MSSVVGGSELSTSLLMSARMQRDLGLNVPRTYRGMKLLHALGIWQDNTDPLGALGELGKYPSIHDESDDQDGWY